MRMYCDGDDGAGAISFHDRDLGLDETGNGLRYDEGIGA